jgi:hypothetical protein
MRQRWFRRLVCSTVIVVLVGIAVPVMAEKESVVRSLLLPGSGQAHQGHYAKAAVFAGAAIITGTGLFLSQVHYNQSVMRYNDLYGIYVQYPSDLQSGTVIRFGEIQETYKDMQAAWDTSEDRKTWRNVFLVAFLATYVVNLVDVVISERETGEKTIEEPSSVGIEMRGEDVLVYKSFRF